MFREMRRQNQALSHEECIAVLTSEKRGVLSVNGDDGYPFGFPINQYYDIEDGCLYFHGAQIGHHIDALKADARACFTVYKYVGNDPDSWVENYHSVIVFGRVEFIDGDDEMTEICRKLTEKFTDDAAYFKYEVDKDLFRTLCFKLVPEHMTGKKVNES